MQEEYFELRQNHMVENAITIIGIDTASYCYKMQEKDFENLEKVTVAYFVGNGEEELCDLLIAPTLMVSDRMKKVLNLYDKKMEFKGVQLYPLVQECTKYPLYWIPKFCETDCLHESTEFNDNGTMKEPVLDKRKLGKSSIVRVTDSTGFKVIISLPVAESLLRRRMYGIELHKLRIV